MNTYLYGAAAAVALIAAAAGVAYVGIQRAPAPPVPEPSWEQYATTTFSISYPPGYTVEDPYTEDVAPGRRVTGVKFVIKPSLAAGTNLSSESYVSVETMPTLVACTPTPYLFDAQTSSPFTEEGHTYSLAKEEGAAIGGFYQKRVYVRLGAKRCIAVRYFIHSNNLNNYEEDAVTAFNAKELLSQFDRIRHSLVIK